MVAPLTVTQQPCELVQEHCQVVDAQHCAGSILQHGVRLLIRLGWLPLLGPLERHKLQCVCMLHPHLQIVYTLCLDFCL